MYTESTEKISPSYIKLYPFQLFNLLAGKFIDKLKTGRACWMKHQSQLLTIIKRLVHNGHSKG